MRVVDLIRLIRPGHWIKNAIVLLPIVFALRLTDWHSWYSAALAAAAFCLAASAIYIINDVRDRESDRVHPKKKERPIASGRVGILPAAVASVVLLAGAVGIMQSVTPVALLILLFYVLLQMAYTFALKGKLLVDVMAIAAGFVLRAMAGAVAIRAEVSPWLIICTFTICMFMGFCKRRNENATIGQIAQAEKHRATLAGYTPELLSHLITLSAGIAIVAYLLYASAPRTIEHFGTSYLVYTVPVVIYGVFRFAMLSMKGAYTDPTDLILHDRPFQLTVAFWSVLVLVIILYGPKMQAWLRSC